jgi:hypothetical protein
MFCGFASSQRDHTGEGQGDIHEDRPKSQELEGAPSGGGSRFPAAIQPKHGIFGTTIDRARPLAQASSPASADQGFLSRDKISSSS